MKIKKGFWRTEDGRKAQVVDVRHGFAIGWVSDCSVQWRINGTKADHFILSRQKVFPSFCDWLDDEVPIHWLAEFLQLIHDTPNLDWLLLTKRPENWGERIEKALHICHDETAAWLDSWLDCVDMPERGDLPENVWIGTSVEDQQRADERIPELLKIPAKLRFLSVEPLLGHVDLQMALESFHTFAPDMSKNPPPVQWVIVGGESGPQSRPCNVDWIRSILRQCKTAQVPCFVKQLGKFVDIDDCEDPAGFDRTCESGTDGRWYAELAHPKGGDPSEWPEDLRVRQFPEVKP